MSLHWISDNQALLLENGEAYFPAVLDAIAGAQHEIIIETFILFEDSVGCQFEEALVAAAKRGVKVELTVDGWGSANLTKRFREALLNAGIVFHVFDPVRRILSWRTHVLRRMHRKLVVIDSIVAFIGGINFSADHLASFGAEAKQDYSVELHGPIVGLLREFASQTTKVRRIVPVDASSNTRPSRGAADVMFVTRDNFRHRTDIERQYRLAIRFARVRVIICNAYFFPGYRLLREIRHAAMRGVRVQLVLQGQPDMEIARFAAHLLYDQLADAGVEIYEYMKRPLHAKVALTDDIWATVGSSNLDPLSLSLNLEANVMIRQPEFVLDLADRLTLLIEHDCQRIPLVQTGRPGFLASLRSALLFHLVRRFPRWSQLIPNRRIRIASSASKS